MHHEALTEKGKDIFPNLQRLGGFYLAGGTALALQIGHRISIDFDLFCASDIPKELLTNVEKVFEGQAISLLANNLEELSLLVRGVKITFLKYPFPLVTPLVTLDGLKALSILELAATKAYTIGRRGTLKDYVDVYFVLSGGHATLEHIMETAERKYGSEFNSRLFLEQLVYLDDLEEVDIMFLANTVTKKDIETFFMQTVQKIVL